MSSPLIERLLTEHGYPSIDLENLDAFSGEAGACVLFLTGDPVQHKESNDVAVILPELIKAFGGALRAGVVDRSVERDLQKKYGFRRWPALVFLTRAGYLGHITGVQNWADYIQQIQGLLASEATPPPGFKITPTAH